MDRISLKMDAKAAMEQANPHPVLVSLVYCILFFTVQTCFSMISAFFSIFMWVLSGFGRFLSEFTVGVVMMVPSLSLSIAGLLILSFIQLGYFGYCLRVANRHPAGIGDLFGYARFFLKACGLFFMVTLLVILWALLFYIPGIIALYRYSQAFYIMAEDPRKGIMECINESKYMMAGHKLDKFILDLSFLGWYLLAGVTCGLALMYVLPYKGVTDAGFYNSLKYGNGGFGQMGSGFASGSPNSRFS